MTTSKIVAINGSLDMLYFNITILVGKAFV